MLRFEDIIQDPTTVLGKFLGSIGFASSSTLGAPSWNGKTLNEVYPWGTIRTPTPAANRATADELSSAEKEEVRVRVGGLLDRLGYAGFLPTARIAA
jgi:hypothetical protein